MTDGTRGFRALRWWSWPALLLAALVASDALAIQFGPEEAFDFRGKVYGQYTIATEDSQAYSNGTALDPAGTPRRVTGNMVQNRFFYAPEFEVNFKRLLRRTEARKWLDEFEGRVSVWGFYDGLYDYGPKGWSEVVADYRRRELQFVTQGYRISEAMNQTAAHRNPRDVYGANTRVNEAYVDIAKGPVWFRIGRQAISWGEADTIGLLDANNPFDTNIQPGLFMDLDEARIPLWTIRGTYELSSSWGPFSSTFLEAYWVPGMIDTTIGPLVIQSASPFSLPPPAAAGPNARPGTGPKLQLFQELPDPTIENSRWGVKVQTVVARDYNLATWFYTTFPTAPVPVMQGISTGGMITTAIVDKLTNVIGVAGSFYSENVNAIVRSEVELFNGEPAFLAYKNLGQVVSSGFTRPGHYDRVNILRGETGMDKNFFIPELNPTSSFLLVTSVVWFLNTDESTHKDYRANGIQKPSAIERQQQGGPPAGFYNGPVCDNPDYRDPVTGEKPPCDFVNMNKLDGFMQATVRTDLMHGTLTPQVTTLLTARGAIGFAPGVVYRLTDNVLLEAKYVNIHTFGSIDNGYTFGIGLNRDRDEFLVRATFQLN